MLANQWRKLGGGRGEQLPPKQNGTSGTPPRSYPHELFYLNFRLEVTILFKKKRAYNLRLKGGLLVVDWEIPRPPPLLSMYKRLTLFLYLWRRSSKHFSFFPFDPKILNRTVLKPIFPYIFNVINAWSERRLELGRGGIVIP